MDTNYDVDEQVCFASDIRLLSKPVVESDVRGESARKTAVSMQSHEDSSTESTKPAVGFEKKSIVTSSNTPLILAGVGFEPYISHLPLEIQARIVKQRTIFPKAEAMIHLVNGGHSAAVSAKDALPVYVRNQVTHGNVKGESGE